MTIIRCVSLIGIVKREGKGEIVRVIEIIKCTGNWPKITVNYLLSVRVATSYEYDCPMVIFWRNFKILPKNFKKNLSKIPKLSVGFVVFSFTQIIYELEKNIERRQYFWCNFIVAIFSFFSTALNKTLFEFYQEKKARKKSIDAYFRLFNQFFQT